MEIKYKIITKEGYTRKGETGETYWLDGKEKVAQGTGVGLCTSDVIHYYDHPLIAVFVNPIHANFCISGSKMIEIEIDGSVAHDGLKGGCKKAKLCRKIQMPNLTTEQRVGCAIKIAQLAYKDEKYNAWANDWISGIDRSEASATSAASAARAEWAASAASAEWAASAARAASAASAAFSKALLFFIKEAINEDHAKKVS